MTHSVTLRPHLPHCEGFVLSHRRCGRVVQGDLKAERLGSLEIDDELEFCGLLHAQIAWLLAFEDSVDISSDNRTDQLADTGGDSHRKRAPECHSGRGAQNVCTARFCPNRTQNSKKA